jgi:heterotetrameric sarcosine oxidase beta subunit
MSDRFSEWRVVREALGGNAGWRPWRRNPEPKPKYDVIIVSEGGHGLVTAYYLAKLRRLTNVAVVEKGWIGGGNAGRNTTIVRSNYLWDESAAIYEHGLKLLESLSEDLSINVMFSQRGVLNLAHTLHDVREVMRRGLTRRALKTFAPSSIYQPTSVGRCSAPHCNVVAAPPDMTPLSGVTREQPTSSASILLKTPK